MLASAIINYKLIFFEDKYILIDGCLLFILLQISFSHSFYQHILFAFAFIYLSARLIHF